MAKQRNSKDELKAAPAIEAASGAVESESEVEDAAAIPKMALASIEQPKFAFPSAEALASAPSVIDLPAMEPTKIECEPRETTKIELASIEAPRIAPEAEEPNKRSF